MLAGGMLVEGKGVGSCKPGWDGKDRRERGAEALPIERPEKGEGTAKVCASDLQLVYQAFFKVVSGGKFQQKRSGMPCITAAGESLVYSRQGECS